MLIFCLALHDYDTLIHFLAVRYRLRPWSVGSKPLCSGERADYHRMVRRYRGIEV